MRIITCLLWQNSSLSVFFILIIFIWRCLSYRLFQSWFWNWPLILINAYPVILVFFQSRTMWTKITWKSQKVVGRLLDTFKVTYIVNIFVIILVWIFTILLFVTIKHDLIDCTRMLKFNLTLNDFNILIAKIVPQVSTYIFMRAQTCVSSFSIEQIRSIKTDLGNATLCSIRS